MKKPKIFIGSSSEGLRIAEALFAYLAPVAEPKLWTHELFLPGQYPLEVLEGQLRHQDFAILVASPDDQLIKRGITSPAMRDNLLLEFGLFAGALGRRRAFFVCPDSPHVELPSDLAGVIMATYDVERVTRGAGEIRAAVQVAGQQIRSVVENEWASIQKKKEESHSRLSASKKGQAIRRLHGVAIELRDTLMVLQRDAFAALSDERAFQDVKRRATERIQTISASFTDDARVVGAGANLRALTEATASALLDLPFPRELSLGQRAAERQAFDIGKRALDTFLRGGDPVRDVKDAASDEAQGLIVSLGRRYAEWWSNHYPKLQQAATSMQDVLFQAAMELSSTANDVEEDAP
jgi:hypothetical protein